MMRPLFFVNTSSRQVRGRLQLQRSSNFETESISTILCDVKSRAFQSSYRRLSVGDGDGVNGRSSPESDINGSASATTQWKRNHYRKIEDKFHPQRNQDKECVIEKKDANIEGSSMEKPEPLAIDNYEDVQPMWKEMESRVTRRRSLTLDEREGVSGRRNVRKSEEDMWLEAGVYDSEKPKNK
eukprot:CAMPEP_0181097434 /NCGR_PEP_ID=MMETSP1071-20121207/11567_1 /TAXON_ID=35127 /ORGANISM="Thalassiosira sp., Strain NH16" /LENGTH=182 /DNA_ID=CAMNT_0023179915 /DNA_START=142 /DNA_END=690 /DNA_ORIENTATION=-